ncbi:MAG: hypothetical protein AB8G17_09695 [Gammaproteobacteria bacterium]
MTSTARHTEQYQLTHTLAGSMAQRTVYGVSLAAVLPVALAASMSGWRWQPWPPGRQGYQSAFKEARLTARNVTAIAFSVN